MRRRWQLLMSAALVFGCQPAERKAPTEGAQAEGYMYSGRNRAAQLASRPSAEAAPLDQAAVTAWTVPTLPVTPDVTTMVIRTATASIEVDSLQPAITQLKLLAARVGGFVANSSIETGHDQLRTAEIEVKIPAARFDEALAGLNPIGKLESVDVQAEDVGEEFVDVNARIDNARRLEQRLIDLLAKRTGKLKDVLDVEQSLARVREEIERYEGRIRYLKAHAAMSTLTVTAHEPVPVVGTAGRSVMGEAFVQAWRNFVTLLSVLVQSLGVVLPLGLIASVVWFVTRRLKLGGAQRAA